MILTDFILHSFVVPGKTERVDSSNFRHMPSSAADVPCQTFPCLLSNLDSYTSAQNFVQRFRGLVGAGTLTCEVLRVDGDGMHHVTLRLPGGQNLINELFKQGAISEKASSESNCKFILSVDAYFRYLLTIHDVFSCNNTVSYTNLILIVKGLHYTIDS